MCVLCDTECVLCGQRGQHCGEITHTWTLSEICPSFTVTVRVNHRNSTVHVWLPTVSSQSIALWVKSSVSLWEIVHKELQTLRVALSYYEMKRIWAYPQTSHRQCFCTVWCRLVSVNRCMSVGVREAVINKMTRSFFSLQVISCYVFI